MKYMFLFLLFFIFVSCQRDVNISLDKVQDDGIMTFVVDNPTEQNIEEIRLGFTFRDDKGEVIKADTVYYRMAEESENKTFLKANDFTWVSQTPPEGTDDVEAYVVSYE